MVKPLVGKYAALVSNLQSSSFLFCTQHTPVWIRLILTHSAIAFHHMALRKMMFLQSRAPFYSAEGLWNFGYTKDQQLCVILDLAGSILFRWRSEEWVLHTRHSSRVIQTVEGCSSCTVHCATGVKWCLFLFFIFFFFCFSLWGSSQDAALCNLILTNYGQKLCNRTEVVFVCSCKWCHCYNSSPQLSW